MKSAKYQKLSELDSKFSNDSIKTNEKYFSESQKVDNILTTLSSNWSDKVKNIFVESVKSRSIIVDSVPVSQKPLKKTRNFKSLSDKFPRAAVTTIKSIQILQKRWNNLITSTSQLSKSDLQFKKWLSTADYSGAIVVIIENENNKYINQYGIIIDQSTHCYYIVIFPKNVYEFNPNIYTKNRGEIRIKKLIKSKVTLAITPISGHTQTSQKGINKDYILNSRITTSS